MAQRRPDTGQKLARAERLGDVVIGSQFEQQDFVGNVASRTQHYDRQRGSDRFDLFTDVASGNLGQSQVKNDSSRRARLETIQSSLAVRLRFDRIPLGLKKPSQSFLYGGVVFNHQNTTCRLNRRYRIHSSAGDEWRCKVPHNYLSIVQRRELPVKQGPSRKRLDF